MAGIAVRAAGLAVVAAQAVGAALAVAGAVTPASLAGQTVVARSTGGLRYEVLATDISARAWTVDQGLPQGSVITLATDAAGYVWGGTFGGLFRLDGRDVRAWTARDLRVLSTNSVSALYGAPDGLLWLGTPAGTIARTRNARLLDTLPSPPVGERAPIDGIVYDADSTLWVKVGHELHGYRDGRWQSLPGRRVISRLAGDRAGRVWFLTNEGLVRLEHGRPSLVVTQRDSLPGWDRAIRVTPEGDVVYAGSTGVYRFDGQLAERVVAMPDVRALAVDARGALWLARGAVLHRLAAFRQTAQAVAPEPILKTGGDIASLANTHDGLLIVGTLDGLLAVRNNAVRLVPFPNVRSRSVTSVATAPDGESLWITSGCTKAMRMTNTGDMLDSLARPGPAGCTYSLLLDHRHRLWAGGEAAIRRRDTTGRDTVWDLTGLGGDTRVVRPLLMHGDTLLFGLFDGRIGRIEPDGAVGLDTRWRADVRQPIESMARGADGTIWVGQAGRLTRWRGDVLAAYGAESALPLAVPRALLPDRAGGVWIGTYGSGIAYFRPGQPAREVPLADPTVSAILPDGNGQLWLPGNRGLTIVSLASLERWRDSAGAQPDWRLVSPLQGFPEGNAGSPAAAVIAPGVLAFATVDGVAVAHARAMATSAPTPPVRIDVIQTPKGERALSDAPLVLAPDERLLQIAFSVPSFSAPDEVQFRYRVEGRDEEWLAVDQRREIRLIGLSPGTYTFRLEARLPGGEWRAAPQPVVFELTPLFSERLWPRVLLLLTVLGLIALYYRQRLRAVEADARVREVQLRAGRAAAELAEQHQREIAQVGRVAVAGELTASLSHELGQPLAAIVNNAEVARRLLARQGINGTPPNPVVEQALLDVVAQGRRASQVVREFRRFLKREHGDRERIAVRELVDSVTLLLRRELEESGVQLTVEVEPATPALLAERVLVQQVLVNLLQNAVEAARQQPRPRVLLRARAAGQGVRITVADSGPGFAPALRRAAFEPFVTTRPDGIGMGLAIARRVVDAHGGHMAVGRLPGAGAVVSLWIPEVHTPAEPRDGLVPQQVTTHA